MIKKFLLVCTGLFVLFNSSCIYIGLFSNEIKRYTPSIVEQISNFSFSNYECDFYYFPESDRRVQFCSIDGRVEYLMTSTSQICYNDSSIEYSYDLAEKTECRVEKESMSYDEYQDVLELIEFLKAFDGTADKVTGRRDIEMDENGSIDEVTYYYYAIDWKYSKGADVNFYISKDTLTLKSLLLMDRSNDDGSKYPHFVFNCNSMTGFTNLKEEYDNIIKEKTAN